MRSAKGGQGHDAKLRQRKKEIATRYAPPKRKKHGDDER
jgi:hypothetical protein